MNRRLLAVGPLFFWLLLSTVSPAPAGQKILVDDYTQGLEDRWTEKSFSGKNRYQVVRDGAQLAIRASSNGTASALMYEIEYDPKQFPVLRWTWKIDNVISRGDARHKETDDFAARVYVVFPSWAFWKTKALNYVWANRLPKGQTVPNAYTANAMMIAVESGGENAGKWVEEKVNVLADYRRCFGEDPPKAGAVAVMTDTDNTGEEATAWYGPIWVLSETTR